MAKKDFRLVPEGYWEYKDFPEKKPDVSFDAIYRAVGLALSAWEGVEEALFHLFLRLSNEFNGEGPLAKTFGFTDSSGARLNIVMDAAKRCFGADWPRQPIKRRFENLKGSVIAAARLRNEIAHGRAIHARGIDLQQRDGVGFSGIFLQAPKYMTARNRGPDEDRYQWSGPFATSSKYRYNSVEIAEIAGKFSALSQKVTDLVFEVTRDENGIPKMIMDLPPEGEKGQ